MAMSWNAVTHTQRTISQFLFMDYSSMHTLKMWYSFSHVDGLLQHYHIKRVRVLGRF